MSRKKRQEKENSERWLLTYSDLITLLVALFIVLYAMSNVDQSKYEALSESLHSSLGKDSSVLSGKGGILDNSGSIIPGISGGAASEDSSENSSENSSEGSESKGIYTKEDMEALQENLDSLLASDEANDDIIITLGESGLIITFSNNAFFDSGDDSLNSKMKNSLKNLSTLLNRIDNRILVEGNADNVPVKNSQFASNWQLSAARAANVAQYLVDTGKMSGSRISAIGYGEYHPIAPNDTAEGRQRNRRIDITVLYDQVESKQ